MDDTYYFEEKSAKAEGLEALDDIDAFEKKLRGEAPAQPSRAAAAPKLHAKVRACSRRATPCTSLVRRAHPCWRQENKPKPANGKKGSAYVQAAVKAPKMTEAQQEAADARSAVADLAKFEQRGFGGR